MHFRKWPKKLNAFWAGSKIIKCILVIWPLAEQKRSESPDFVLVEKIKCILENGCDLEFLKCPREPLCVPVTQHERHAWQPQFLSEKNLEGLYDNVRTWLLSALVWSHFKPVRSRMTTPAKNRARFVLFRHITCQCCAFWITKCN